MLTLTFTRYHIFSSLQRIFTTHLKNCRLLFSAEISEHFSKNCVIICVVAVKIWYLKNVRFLLGHPVEETHRTVSPEQLDDVWLTISC